MEKNINISGKDVVLHGQVDSIVSTEQVVSIYDYKTKESMSENEIKGLTKNSDGNYWRQLVFYKILGNSFGPFAGKDINTSLVFIKPDSKGRCPIVTLSPIASDETKLLEEIEVLVKDVVSGEFINKKCDDVECQYCKYKNILLL